MQNGIWVMHACYASPLRCRRAASASLRRGWKAFLAAICFMYLMSLMELHLPVTGYFKGEESHEKCPLWGDHLLFTASITYVATSSQNFTVVDLFASHTVLVIICFFSAAGTQQPCWMSPSVQGWVSRGNKQIISVESRYICPKHVMILWWRRSLKADIICWWSLRVGKAANLLPETTSGTAGCLLHTGTEEACVALLLISCAY